MGPLVLIGKDLVLERSRLKIEDKEVPYIYICTYTYLFGCNSITTSLKLGQFAAFQRQNDTLLGKSLGIVPYILT